MLSAQKWEHNAISCSTRGRSSVCCLGFYVCLCVYVCVHALLWDAAAAVPWLRIASLLVLFSYSHRLNSEPAQLHRLARRLGLPAHYLRYLRTWLPVAGACMEKGGLSVALCVTGGASLFFCCCFFLLLLFSSCDPSFEGVHCLARCDIKVEGAHMHTHTDVCCSYFIFINTGRSLCSFSWHCEHDPCLVPPPPYRVAFGFFANVDSCWD